jgi:hypothetical protein
MNDGRVATDDKKVHVTSRTVTMIAKPRRTLIRTVTGLNQVRRNSS